MFGFLRKKKKDEQAEAQLKKTLTANDFVNVKDVDGTIVFTKDNKLYSYIKIKPFSLELLSEEEQRLRGRQFTAEFSAINRAYKFFSISRPVDVTFMLDNLTQLNAQTDDPKRKELIRHKIAEINQFALSGDILEHQFFLVLWVQNKKDAQKELLKLSAEVMSRFKACGVDVSLCNEKEIIKLFNLFANPNYAHLEDADVEEYIPFVGKN